MLLANNERACCVMIHGIPTHRNLVSYHVLMVHDIATTILGSLKLPVGAFSGHEYMYDARLICRGVMPASHMSSVR